MALTSLSARRRYSPNGIGGPSVLPSRPRPSRIARITSSSVHRPIPVSGSGVMFGEIHVPSPSSSSWKPPARCFPGRSPVGPFGV